MKTFGQYCPVVLFIMLYKAILTFNFVNAVLSVTIQTKSPVLLFVVLCRVVGFESVDKMLKGSVYIQTENY